MWLEFTYLANQQGVSNALEDLMRTEIGMVQYSCTWYLMANKILYPGSVFIIFLIR